MRTIRQINISNGPEEQISVYPELHRGRADKTPSQVPFKEPTALCSKNPPVGFLGGLEPAVHEVMPATEKILPKKPAVASASPAGFWQCHRSTVINSVIFYVIGS